MTSISSEDAIVLLYMTSSLLFVPDNIKELFTMQTKGFPH